MNYLYLFMTAMFIQVHSFPVKSSPSSTMHLGSGCQCRSLLSLDSYQFRRNLGNATDTSWHKLTQTDTNLSKKKTPSEKPRRQRLSWPLLLGSPAQGHRSHVSRDEWSEWCHTRVANRFRRLQHVQISSDSVSIGFAAWFWFRHVQILYFTWFPWESIIQISSDSCCQ